ncbi:MAG TPA: DUF4199 domain-containing protein [Caulobacterales bacterium]|nr:DUF4199 domain-containing protein [Caulobacterales bacterium]
MLKTALTYGSVSGVFVIGVILWGLAAQGGHNGGIFGTEWFGYLIMILALSTIFLAIRDYRNKKLGGVIKFLPALGLGLMIAAFAGIAYALAWEVYLAVTHYRFMDEYVASIIARQREAGVSGAALEAKIAELNQMKAAYANPLFRLPMTFLEIFPVGLLIALISAAVLRNPKVLPARG